MNNEDIIRCLNDRRMTIDEKRTMLEQCNLVYSDYFTLMEEFKYDSSIVSMLKSLVYDGDKKLENDVKKYFRDNRTNRKNKRMKKVRRLESYD